MNTDIRLSVHFLDHPKTIKLERRLGFQGVRSLLALWTWAALNRPDGNLDGSNDRSTTVQRPFDEEDIEIAAKWPGEPGLFVETLVSLGWLDQNETGYTLHEWLEHNPWAAAADNRGNKARFSRMAKTHPHLYKSLYEQGIREISAQEYARLKAEYVQSTPVERPLNDRSTNANVSLTPSPSPSPSPNEEKERRGTKPLATLIEPSTTVACAPVVPATSESPRHAHAMPNHENPDVSSPTEKEEAEPLATLIKPSTAVARAPAPPAASSRSKSSAKEDLPAPPDWLPESVWQAFVDHRRALKKPLTAQGARFTLQHLDKARGYGHDPVELVETAIAAGWRGCVFEDKHFQSAAPGRAHAADRPQSGHCRPLLEPHTNPDDYRDPAGFRTELEEIA